MRKFMQYKTYYQLPLQRILTNLNTRRFTLGAFTPFARLPVALIQSRCVGPDRRGHGMSNEKLCEQRLPGELVCSVKYCRGPTRSDPQPLCFD